MRNDQNNSVHNLLDIVGNGFRYRFLGVECMSRFTGWSAKDVEKLTGENLVKKVGNYSKVIQKKKDSPDYVGMISGALTMLGIAHEREYKFLHDRRFRFDLAIPKHLIALEWEGGIFSGGRHVRGKGYANDAKKYNLATRHGWKLLRYTTEDTKELNWEFRVADEIKSMLKTKPELNY